MASDSKLNNCIWTTSGQDLELYIFNIIREVKKAHPKYIEFEILLDGGSKIKFKVINKPWWKFWK